MISELGAGRVVLPELEALRGVEQNRFHHLDVLGHTLEVLERTIELAGPTGPCAADLQRAYGESQQAVRDLLGEPLADEMTRGEALRWGALLHDAAKPMTRSESPLDGRVTFMGHDVRGRSSPATCSAGCARATGSRRMSRRSRASTCAWAFWSTSPSRSRVACSTAT